MTVTGDALFIGLLILGMFLMLFSNKRRNMLVSLTTFIVWFGLGMWLFFGDSAPIGFGDTWKEILGWGFLVLSFLPFIFAMDQEIMHEAQGKRWTKYGQEPKQKGPSNYERYRDALYNRTRRGRRG